MLTPISNEGHPLCSLGGDFLVPIPPEEMNHLSKSPCRDQDESFFFTPLPQTKPKRQYGGPTVDETVEKTELDRRRRDDFVLPTVPTHSVIFDPIGGKAFAPPSWGKAFSVLLKSCSILL